MTTITVETSQPDLTVSGAGPAITASSSRIFAAVTGEDNIDLSVVSSPVEVTVSGEDNIDLSVVSQPIVIEVSVGPASGGDSNVTNVLVGLSWGTPGAEASDIIEISGSILDYDGNALASSIVDVEIMVTDGATDGEPSATATLAAASTPSGTVLAGSGTATIVVRSNAGVFAIAVHETAVAHRFLWVRGAGHERLWVRAVAGVQELVFA